MWFVNCLVSGLVNGLFIIVNGLVSDLVNGLVRGL